MSIYEMCVLFTSFLTEISSSLLHATLPSLIIHEKLIQIFPLFVMFHDIEQNHNNHYRDRDENNLFTKEV